MRCTHAVADRWGSRQAEPTAPAGLYVYLRGPPQRELLAHGLAELRAVGSPREPELANVPARPDAESVSAVRRNCLWNGLDANCAGPRHGLGACSTFKVVRRSLTVMSAYHPLGMTSGRGCSQGEQWYGDGTEFPPGGRALPIGARYGLQPCRDNNVPIRSRPSSETVSVSSDGADFTQAAAGSPSGKAAGCWRRDVWRAAVRSG